MSDSPHDKSPRSQESVETMLSHMETLESKPKKLAMSLGIKWSEIVEAQRRGNHDEARECTAEFRSMLHAGWNEISIALNASPPSLATFGDEEYLQVRLSDVAALMGGLVPPPPVESEGKVYQFVDPDPARTLLVAGETVKVMMKHARRCAPSPQATIDDELLKACTLWTADVDANRDGIDCVDSALYKAIVAAQRRAALQSAPSTPASTNTGPQAAGSSESTGTMKGDRLEQPAAPSSTATPVAWRWRVKGGKGRWNLAPEPWDAESLKNAGMEEEPLYASPSAIEPAKGVQERLTKLQVGGCTCDTKTPELKYHADRCVYRLAAEIQMILLGVAADGGANRG
jgi:hypothetical protein